MRKSSPFLQVLSGIATTAGIAALAYLFFFTGETGSENRTELSINRKLARDAKTYHQLQFDLVDPNGAPESIQELVKLGFKLMVHTKEYAAGHTGNQLSCTHCHFAGGNTTGGAQGGISLAGVAAKYPAFDEGLGKVIDLPDRINNCFLKSMNGQALSLESRLMLALTTYLHWISKDLPIYGNIPWLGLKPLASGYKANSRQGKQIYDTYCATCHKEDYRGSIYPPALWGAGSFNDGAGLAVRTKLAAFIFWNMPYGDKTPLLSEEQAQDVAAYVLTKPRPQFISIKN